MVKIEQKKARRKGKGEGQTGVQGGTWSHFQENMVLNGKHSFCAGPIFFIRDQCSSNSPKGAPFSWELCLNTSGLQAQAGTL